MRAHPDDLVSTPLQRLVPKQGHFPRSLGSGLPHVDLGLHFVLEQVTLSSEQGWDGDDGVELLTSSSLLAGR